jgi:hypothetical protein
MRKPPVDPRSTAGPADQAHWLWTRDLKRSWDAQRRTGEGEKKERYWMAEGKLYLKRQRIIEIVTSQ